MNLRKEVLYRLLLAKSILTAGRSAPLGQPNPHVVARQVLNAHDAADLVFAATADHQGKLAATNKAPSMVECLRSIDSKKNKYEGYFKQLNDARNSLKHVGNLPNTNQWASVAQDVFEKLSSLCQTTLSISLDEVDESELLVNNKARTHLATAKKARASQKFKLALSEIGKALFVSLSDAPDLRSIEVGRAKAEDALKLTAFGVPANDFLRLQEFLPLVSVDWSEDPGSWEPSEPLWKQSKFGHPGNWREDVVDFCIGAYINVGLCIQNASTIPYAREFSDLYEYKVTAREDQVEVWEDLAYEDQHLTEIHSGNASPFRVQKRFLKKGESVLVPTQAQPFVSDDLSPSGDSIKRVRISFDDMSGFYGLPSAGSKRAEFVNLAGVNIICVPQKWTHDHSLALPEIPWEEDPLAFRLEALP
jgi:hypothetical protein